MALTDDDLEGIAKAVQTALKPRHVAIDEDTHKSHHDYIALQVEKASNRKKQWDKFKMSAIGTVATSLVVMLIAFGESILHFLRGH